MMAEFTRDAATTAAIFGLAAASWFRWAQANLRISFPWRDWPTTPRCGAICTLTVDLPVSAFTGLTTAIVLLSAAISALVTVVT